MALSRGYAAASAVALTVSMSAGAAHAQSVEAVKVGDVDLKLVVPPGYCKVDQEKGGKTYAGLERNMSADGFKLLLLYVDCDKLDKLQESAIKYGFYTARMAEGQQFSRKPAATSLESALKQLNSQLDPLDPSGVPVQSLTNLRMVQDEGLHGLLGVDGNASYAGQVKTRQSRVTYVIEAGMYLKDIYINNQMSIPAQKGDTLDPLLTVQKTTSAALVKAN